MISIKNQDMIRLDELSAAIAEGVQAQTLVLVNVYNSGREPNDGEFASSCNIVCMNNLKAAYLLGRADGVSGNGRDLQ